MQQRKGLNIFYYGKGKGKTTAVVGLAVRAAGAGMNVFILQFVKAKRPKPGQKLQSGEWPVSSEINYFEAVAEQSAKGADKKIGKIDSLQSGLGFVGILGDNKQRSAHIKEAQRALTKAKKVMHSGKYQLVILDELISALELKLVTEKEILQLIKDKPVALHLAYTGHNSFKKVIALSDLVSDIQMVKHPYYKGVLAQRGIDF